jgi:hypothetical protein
MGSLHTAIDETFLVDTRELPDEALKQDIGGLARAVNRINAGLLSASRCWTGVVPSRLSTGRPEPGCGSS